MPAPLAHYSFPAAIADAKTRYSLALVDKARAAAKAESIRGEILKLEQERDRWAKPRKAGLRLVAGALALTLLPAPVAAAQPVVDCWPAQVLFDALHNAGQQPTRLATAPDGREAWVSDDLATGARVVLSVEGERACVVMSGVSDVGYGP